MKFSVIRGLEKSSLVTQALLALETQFEKARRETVDFLCDLMKSRGLYVLRLDWKAIYGSLSWVSQPTLNQLALRRNVAGERLKKYPLHTCKESVMLCLDSLFVNCT